MNNDTLRAAIIALIQSIFPMLQVLGIAHFSGDDIAVLMLFVTNAVTLGFLLLKKAPTATVAGVAALMMLTGLVDLGGSTRVASAAVDCTQVASLRVEVIDTDAAEPGTRINHVGAMVTISPDPYDGTGNPNLRIIRDNGSFDDSALTGRIEIEENVCASASNLPRDDYEVTLSFDASVFRCDIASPTLRANTARGDETIRFLVDDCAQPASPTLTPAPTATPTTTAMPTFTPTPAPAPPVFVPVPVVQTVTVERFIEVPALTIRPPSTGDAGIK